MCICVICIFSKWNALKIVIPRWVYPSPISAGRPASLDLIVYKILDNVEVFLLNLYLLLETGQGVMVIVVSHILN